MGKAPEDLLRDSRRGKEAPFVRLFDDHHLPLFRFAWRLTGSMADAEDIVQECFLGLLRAECGFDPARTAIRTYLFGAVRNQALKRLRRREQGEAAEGIDHHTPEAEALLIFAARCQHVTHLIMPALRRGTVVLCDRFSDSTLAYQGFARGLDLQWLREANEVATGGLTPDLTLLLDLPVSVGLARRRADRGQQNRLDRETERFHRKVRRGFLALADEEPNRMTIVNANRPAQEVQDELTEIVLGWMARPRRSSRRRR